MYRAVLLVLSFALAAGLVLPDRAESAQKRTEKKTEKKKKPSNKGRDDYTKEERAKMMTRARQVCRKNFGAPSTVYRIDYKSLRVYCWRPGA
jgi:hypothetical protein